MGWGGIKPRALHALRFDSGGIRTMLGGDLLESRPQSTCDTPLPFLIFLLCRWQYSLSYALTPMDVNWTALGVGLELG